MKNKSLYIGAMTFALSGMLVGCADSYLDVNPATDVIQEELSNPSVARSAMAGIYENMNVQYGGYDLNQNVGEAYVNLVCNDVNGDDYISGIWNDMPGLQSWSRMGQETAYANGLAWMYYYGLIGQANRIIGAIPETSQDDLSDLSDDTRQLLQCKAEALTMRAHGYSKLLSYYGQRWEDSDNGEAYCMPLKLESNLDYAPLAKMNTIFNQVYTDCEEAIALYEASGLARSNKWECNADVANGVWARTALLKHDWATASAKAKAARAGYTVMDQTTLFAGFFTDNSDFIWHMNPTELTTYYWSWGSHYSCNGAYTNNWGFGAGAINIDIYNTMDANDLRRQFFWTPDKLSELSNTFNPARLKEASFWNPNMVDASSMLNMTFTNVYDRTGRDKLGYGMLNCAVGWLYNYYNKIYTGDRDAIVPEDSFYNYLFLYNKSNDKYRSVRVGRDAQGRELYGEAVNLPFGAQCKFWSITPYGNMAYPWMRASEMALAEAEAEYMMGNEANAKKALEEVMKNRVPGYTCKTSGTALRDEIRNNRRVELFGEGQGFTDLKRWNLERTRRVWEANKPTSGNCTPNEKITREQQVTTYCNGWRFTIPARERQYNPAIDVSLLKKF